MTKIHFNGVARTKFLERVGRVKLELFLLRFKILSDIELSLEPRDKDLYTATIKGKSSSGPIYSVARSSTNLCLAIILAGEAFEVLLTTHLPKPEKVYDERL